MYQCISVFFLHAAIYEATHQMVCECEKTKQKFLMKHIFPDDDVCVFSDVTQLMDDNERKCVRHDKACDSLLKVVSLQYILHPTMIHVTCV